MSSPSRFSSTLDLSVIVVSHNEGERLQRTVHSLLASIPSRSEIIIVDDASTDGSADVFGANYGGVTVLRADNRLGVASARNFGVRSARGAIFVFADAHVETPLGWFAPIQAALASAQVGVAAPAVAVMGSPSAKGYGLRWKDAALNVEWLAQRETTPYPVPMVSACFMAARRDAFDCLGGFDEGLLVRGGCDTEFCLRLWTMGYECWLVPSVEIAHLFRTTYPYRVEQAKILHNLLRIGVVHFGEDRLRQLTASLTGEADFSAAFALLAESDAWERRGAVQAARRHDDEWFYRRFPR